MNYEQYKALLVSQGFSCMARYMGTGVEAGCSMFNPENQLNIEITMKEERIVANASVVIRGLINPITTGDFGQPDTNTAFHAQCRRLAFLKRFVGDFIIRGEL